MAIIRIPGYRSEWRRLCACAGHRQGTPFACAIYKRHTWERRDRAARYRPTHRKVRVRGADGQLVPTGVHQRYTRGAALVHKDITTGRRARHAEPAVHGCEQPRWLAAISRGVGPCIRRVSRAYLLTRVVLWTQKPYPRYLTSAMSSTSTIMSTKMIHRDAG